MSGGELCRCGHLQAEHAHEHVGMCRASACPCAYFRPLSERPPPAAELCPNCKHAIACHSAICCTMPDCECRVSFASSMPCAPAIRDAEETPPVLLRCDECGAVSEPGEEPCHTHSCSRAQLSASERIALLERAVETLVQGELRAELEEIRRELGDVRHAFGARLDLHVDRLARLERPVDSRDAIVWEIGHAAALRGDALHANPFRKLAQ